MDDVALAAANALRVAERESGRLARSRGVGRIESRNGAILASKPGFDQGAPALCGSTVWGAPWLAEEPWKAGVRALHSPAPL